MAVHNEQASVEQAVNSVIAQTFEQWELIIIDDASDDETASIIQSWCQRDQRIRLLRNPRNLGLAASLNIGWQAARYDLIARLDGDDCMLPQRLEHQADRFRCTPEIDVLGTAAHLIDSQGNDLGIARRPAEHAELCSQIYRNTPFIHPSVMMRRSFLQRTGGYDATLRRSQDYDLWLRGKSEFRYHNLQQPLIRYRVRAKMSLAAIFYGTWVLTRAVWRDRAAVQNYIYPARFLAATGLTKLGFCHTRLR